MQAKMLAMQTLSSLHLIALSGKLVFKNMVQTQQKRKGEKRTSGRAAGGAARMASLSPEQRQQLARAAAAARWQQVGGASKQPATRPQQAALLARMCKELSALRQQRKILDRQILGLTQAVESFGVQVPSDSEVSTE
jgi:hypothetical protein